MLGEQALRRVLDVTQQVFNGDLFSVGCSDRAGDVGEVPGDIAIFIELLLGKESLSGQANLVLLLNVNDNKNGVRVVAADNLVKLNVILLDLRTGGVPTHDALLGVDSSHHVEHLLVVDVIEKPNVWLFCVLLKGHSVAVRDVKGAIISVFADEHSNHSL